LLKARLSATSLVQSSPFSHSGYLTGSEGTNEGFGSYARRERGPKTFTGWPLASLMGRPDGCQLRRNAVGATPSFHGASRICSGLPDARAVILRQAARDGETAGAIFEQRAEMMIRAIEPSNDHRPPKRKSALRTSKSALRSAPREHSRGALELMALTWTSRIRAALLVPDLRESSRPLVDLNHV
jgi:hypothetical protein